MITAVLFLIASGGVTASVPPSAVALRPYLEINGKEVKAAAVRLEKTSTAVIATFAAPRDGVYRFGIVLMAHEIRPLAAGMVACDISSLPKLSTLLYPYDWQWTGREIVMDSRSRLMMPGVEAGARIYLADTRELWSLTLRPASAKQVQALFLKHRIFNDGGDMASSELHLKGGQQESLTLLIFDSLSAAKAARAGQHLPLQGTMTQVPHRGWTGVEFTPDQHRQIAERFQGVFDYVILREAKIADWIPPIYHQRGIKVLNYQYLGALRRRSVQVDPAVEQEIALRDASGQLYTAPTAPNGAWLLADLRRTAVRQRFVDNVRTAVLAGFDGIFLDGYPFWTDGRGRVGGSVAEAKQSLNSARWQLLGEIKAAIRKANPQGFLGALGNEYFEFLGTCDFVAREKLYATWDNGSTTSRDFQKRRTAIRQDLSAALEERESPFVATTILCGAKGYSPIAVQSCVHFVRRPSGLVYLEMGDFLEKELDPWLEAMVRIAQKKDLYITTIMPASTWIHFEDLATIRSDEPCSVRFSKPVCVATDQGDQRDNVIELKVLPKVHYQVGCGSVR